MAGNQKPQGAQHSTRGPAATPVQKSRAPLPPEHKPDLGLYVGIVFGIASVFFFVLQSNGVEVNWLCSAVIYAACALGAVWTTLKHALPGRGRLPRFTASSLLVSLCAVLGSIGTVKQYHKENRIAATRLRQPSTQSQVPTVTRAPSQPSSSSPSHPTSGNPKRVLVKTPPSTPAGNSRPDEVGRDILGFPRGPFRENIRTITVVFGTSTNQFQVSDLMQGPEVIDNDSDFEISLKDNSIHYQIQLLGPHGILIIDNKFSALHPLWDSNSSMTAFEIVNELHSPIFQFIREGDSQIAVYGAFQGTNGVRFMTKDPSGPQWVKSFNYHTETVPGLKPIFKYPSWKFPGQYADQ